MTICPRRRALLFAYSLCAGLPAYAGSAAAEFAASPNTSNVTVVYNFAPDAPGPIGFTYSEGNFYIVTRAGYGGAILALSLDGKNRKVLHVYPGNQDTSYIFAQEDLLVFNRYLYGTTYGDGIHSNENDPSGNGTVFRLALNGAYKVLHSFQGGADGNSPGRGLTEIDGVFYGTAEGGTGGKGTVFKINPDGAGYAQIYAFRPGVDGDGPNALMTNINGVLYGTTDIGGAHQRGTVFRVTTTGRETVLHSLGGSPTAPEAPSRPLVPFNGLLYGMALGGQSFLQGAVFSIDVHTRTFKVVHYFRKPPGDGNGPQSLLRMGNLLYGATDSGGRYGYGTIYSLDVSGKETVLYSFPGGAGGWAPTKLINVNGTIYGITAFGGDAGCSLGCGTLFKFIP